MSVIHDIIVAILGAAPFPPPHLIIQKSVTNFRQGVKPQRPHLEAGRREHGRAGVPRLLTAAPFPCFASVVYFNHLLQKTASFQLLPASDQYQL